MRKLFNCMIPALVIAVLLSIAPFYDSCKELNHDVLRVHILANSDSAADQSLKLAVRDRVVEQCAAFYEGCDSKEQAMAVTVDHLSEIEHIAEDAVREYGFDYPVHAEVDEMFFNTRYYDDFTMPAGRYDALRLTIGAGEGRNWWCVLFPTLCIGAACGDGMQGALSDDEYRVVTTDRVDFRFKVVEFFEGFLDHFR